MIKAEEYIMFAGRDWQIIKTWLTEQQEQKIGLLIAATNHDKSNEYRGALSMIRQVLALETAAELAAKRNANG